MNPWKKVFKNAKSACFANHLFSGGYDNEQVWLTSCSCDNDFLRVPLLCISLSFVYEFCSRSKAALVKCSRKQSFPGPNKNASSRVQRTWVQWVLVYPVSNFDYEQRKASQRCGSIPVFTANFLTAKWSANSDVNVPDTRTRTLKHASHCERGLKCIQQFCMVTRDTVFRVLPAYWTFPAHLRLWTCDPAMRTGLQTAKNRDQILCRHDHNGA